ncbi:MAG: hypothetical protein GY850_31740, partial [bacterium]|nr:hypothetical protein [bacterium]
MAFQLLVNERFTILPKEVGSYHSFPTLIRIGEMFGLACRSGKVDRSQPHGFEGVVRLLITNVAEP